MFNAATNARTWAAGTARNYGRINDFGAKL
jgi:hypothetical protein